MCGPKLEKLNLMIDHSWCTRLGVEWFLCGLKMANCESAKKDAVIGWIGVFSTPLATIFGCC